MTEKKLEQFNDYLGDGVYASFDGDHIWLAANHHTNKVIALEPRVFANLVNYKDRISKIIEEGEKSANEGL